MTKPKTVTLQSQEADIIRVYVPVSRRSVAEGSASLVKARFLAGGWTCRRVGGGWISPAGEIVTELVDEYEFLVPADKVKVVRQYLITFSEELLASGEQAVLVVVSHSGGTTITYTLS